MNNIKVGDLLKITRKDDKTFTCLVVENYNGGFISKILEKDEGVGSGSWSRYGLNQDFRFQLFDECKDIQVISEAKKYTAKSTLTLNESVSNNDLTYYETNLGNGKKALFCVCEGYGGWAIDTEDKDSDLLKESFIEAQISQIRSNNQLNS